MANRIAVTAEIIATITSVKASIANLSRALMTDSPLYWNYNGLSGFEPAFSIE
jgi:hypothetical protein